MQRRANGKAREGKNDGEKRRPGGLTVHRRECGGKLTGREKREAKRCRGDAERPDEEQENRRKRDAKTRTYSSI